MCVCVCVCLCTCLHVCGVCVFCGIFCVISSITEHHIKSLRHCCRQNNSPVSITVQILDVYGCAVVHRNLNTACIVLYLFLIQPIQGVTLCILAPCMIVFIVNVNYIKFSWKLANNYNLIYK